MIAPVSIHEIMTEDVKTITPGESATQAAIRLQQTGVGSLVVLDDGPVGIVTREDLLGLLADERAADVRAAIGEIRDSRRADEGDPADD